MATLELDDSGHSFARLVHLCPAHIQVRRSLDSPAGYQWIELLIEDSAMGEFRAGAAAEFLSTLQQASATFGAFRIVSGDQWLRRAAAIGT